MKTAFLAAGAIVPAMAVAAPPGVIESFDAGTAIYDSPDLNGYSFCASVHGPSPVVSEGTTPLVVNFPALTNPLSVTVEVDEIDIATRRARFQFRPVGADVWFNTSVVCVGDGVEYDVTALAWEVGNFSTGDGPFEDRYFDGLLSANGIIYDGLGLPLVPLGEPDPRFDIQIDDGFFFFLNGDGFDFGVLFREVTTSGVPTYGNVSLAYGRFDLEVFYRVRPCNPADVALPIGLLDLNDLTAFVNAFVSMDLGADLTGDSIIDLSDVVLFVDSFIAGCPEIELARAAGPAQSTPVRRTIAGIVEPGVSRLPALTTSAHSAAPAARDGSPPANR